MKKLYAFGTLVMGIASAALIAAALGTETWTITKVVGNNSANTSLCQGTRIFGLFNGFDEVFNCFGGGQLSYSMLDEDVPVDYAVALQYVVIVFCGLAIMSSLMAIFVSGYNLVSRPYETYAGPVGMLIYFTSGLFFVLMAVILYVSLYYTDFQSSIPSDNCSTQVNICTTSPNLNTIDSTELGYSFYLIVASLCTFLIGVVLVLFAGKEFTKKIKNKCCPSSFGTDEIDMDNKNSQDGIMY